MAALAVSSYADQRKSMFCSDLILKKLKNVQDGKKGTAGRYSRSR